MFTKFISQLILASTVLLPVNQLLAAEPTAAQMKEALLQGMQHRGGTRSGSSAVSIDNSINGMDIAVSHFEKLGCEKAVSQSGYNCDYAYSIDLGAHSNENSAAGDQHARAMNTLMKFFIPQNQVRTSSRRFIQSGSRWVVIGE